MRSRAALTVLVCLIAGASSLPAQTIRLDLSLTVRESPESVQISSIIANRGHDPAYEVTAELRGVNRTPRPVTGELPPGDQAEIAWEVDPERWRAELREIAALRIGYHDASGTRASSVTALGEEGRAAVAGPGWPDDPTLQVVWSEPTGSGRAVWWSATELTVEGDNRWRTENGTATLLARLRPATDITGWETKAFLLVLPDDAAAPGRIVPVEIDARSLRSLWRPDLRLLAAWTALCLIVWLSATRIASGGRLSTLPPLVAVLALGAVGLTLFPPRLLFLDTTPAGGDYASHIVALDQLRNVLLPSGRVYGWSMDQYAGFPLFLFYFPLAFLVMAGLSAVLPLTVAMKIGSLTGALLLPLAWATSLRWLGAPRPARWIAPAAALAFLLIETQATWGGNLASLLAGEFAFALGFPLAWLAATHAWKTRDRVAGWWPAGVLLALAGLAHGYTLVCGALGIGLLALHPRLWWRRWWHVARIGLLAFGLLGWWLIPLLANLPWTNGFRERWEIGGPGELLPPAVGTALAILAAGVLWRLVNRKRPILAAGQVWLVAFAAVLLAAYQLGYSLGVVDVRFLPMMQGALLLAGCWEAGAWIDEARPARRPVFAAATVAAISVAAVLAVVYLPSWARWNMGGMERASRWPDYRGVMRAVAGGIDEPRVAWEHHPDHNAAGTIRAFELLPWFARRATLEGLYFQSAALAPAIFYLQSEISLQPSCPLPAYECGRFRPAAAGPHLRLLGASQLIAYTDSLTRALARSTDFEERSRSGVYSAFALTRPPRLVEPVHVHPVADRFPDWRSEAYDWFRAGTDLDVPLVLGEHADGVWASVERYRPGALPRVPYTTRPSVSAEIRDGAVRIDTDTPGHPLLVKVGYHPGWRASDGSRVDLVAPGMLLVTPRSGSVTLSWNAGRPGRLGVLLTGVTLLAIAAGAARMRRAGPGALVPRLPETGRGGWIGIGVVAVLAATAAGVMLQRHPPLDHPALLAEGQRQLADGRFPEAVAIFDRMLAADTPHGLRDDAAFHQVLVPLEAGDRDTALEQLEAFLEAYPVSTYRAEALVRMSDLLAAHGEAARARRARAEALDAPLAPDSWRTAARERLE